MNSITEIRRPRGALPATHPLADLELIEDIKAVAATQPPRLQPVFDWLLERASTLEPLPRYGKRLNMRGIAEATGVGRDFLNSHDAVLRPLFERFATVSVPDAPRRERLPGCEEVGTNVPTPVLIAALQADLSISEDENRRKILFALITIASADRKLPIWRGRANFRAVADAAGIENAAKWLNANRQFVPDWAAFFDLCDKQRWSGDPDYPPKRVVAVAVRTYLAGLPSGAKLRHQPGRPNEPSFLDIADVLNLDIDGVKAGKSRNLIKEHFDRFVGPSQPAPGRTPEEKRARRERRDEILRFAKGLVDAGIPLPGTRRNARQIDLVELVRLSGGGSVPLGDTYLTIKLGRLKPKVVAYHDRGGTPRNYAQLADGFAIHRRDSPTVAAGSKASTESKARKAIETFRTHLGKGPHDPVGSDFDEKSGFAEIVQDLKAQGVWGKQSANWVTEINAASKWLAARATVDLLGDDFATVLRSAIVNADLPLAEVVAGTAVRTEYLTAWMRRTKLPTKESFGDLETIAERLGLDSRRLVDLVPTVGDTNPHTRIAGGFPPFVYAFLPDDWRTKKPDQLGAMVKWIDENLCHVNSMFGATMREVAKSRKAELAREKDEEDEFGGTGPLEIEADGEVEEELVKDEFEKQLAQLPTRLADEMRLLIRHMTVDFPRKYARRGGTKWAIASTAPMRVRRLLGFFKWQTLPTQRGGLGRNAEELTLGDLIHVPLMFAYLDFKARSLEHVEHEGHKRGKVFTGTEVDLLSIAKALVSSEFGIVTQRTELAKRIVADNRPLDAGSYISLAGHVYAIDEDDEEEDEDENEAEEGEVDDREDDRADDDGEDTVAIMPAELCGLSAKKFVAACRQAELRYRAAAVDLDEEVDMIRDPMEPIAPILDDPQPMAILLRQLALAERKCPSVDHLALQHHLHKRDVLMNRLLALTSLRSKNIREILVDGTRPNLVFDETKKQWLLKIHWRRFKNYRTCTLFGRKRKRQWYRKWLPNTHGLYDLIEYYVGTSRPWFLARCNRGKPGKELFLTSKGRPLKAEQVWKAVNRFTARHIAWNPFRKEGVPGVQPFGPHAYRDIRATNILLNPQTNNPYLEAAMALQTSTQMIVNHYGLVRVEKRTAADDVGYFKSEELAWAMIKG